MQVSRTVYRVVVVDKTKDKLIVDTHVVANETSAAIANVAIKEAKKIAGKEVYTYATSIATYSKDVA